MASGSLPVEERRRVEARWAEHDLQFYEESCEGTIQLDELHRITLQRLLTLNATARIDARNANKTPSDCRRLLMRRLRAKGIDLFADLRDAADVPVAEERLEARRADNVAHNVLRLLLVDNDESRAWFHKWESVLFRWRLEGLDAMAVRAFRTVNRIIYPELSPEAKMRMRGHIAPLMDKPESYEETTFYEVSAFEVPELLRERAVHIKSGSAYIVELQFRALLAYQFQRRLDRVLRETMGAKHYVQDTRMQVLDAALRKIYKRLMTPSINKEEITIDDLNELSATSYPPCMRVLHEELYSRCHLRNGGRVQYTLFLKAMGLTASDAEEFYRDVFTRKITPAQFRKEYAYQFRHMYGLVGACKDYGSQQCVRIAEESYLGPNDCHGCFFANRDIEELGQHLKRWRIPANHARNIASFARTKNYGRGCAAYFEALHGTPVFYPIVRPDDFFQQSRKIIKTRNLGDVFSGDDKSE